ncbi:MAG: ligase-associated DNA damage response endonuclease PdeM [Pseudoruegeria sp.]
MKNDLEAASDHHRHAQHMNGYSFRFGGTQLTALPSGALYWPDAKILCVSDLHLGKSERVARLGGPLVPPYESQETLLKLKTDIDKTAPNTVICLGDSFDDALAASKLGPQEMASVSHLQNGREWIWIEGNHDPGPVGFSGITQSTLNRQELNFCHIGTVAPQQEISGHYHPKKTITLKGRRITRPCFLISNSRIIMPAYGTYTGGLNSDNPVFIPLFETPPRIILTGRTAIYLNS